ncbi:MAG TPA: DUF4280 domain-containing protein [Polyangiaceae bacterium]
MPKLVVHGATLICSMGSTPSSFTVLPARGTSFGRTTPAATVQDTFPITNIASFGMCKSPLNPQVAAATAAAAGVLTPQPCVPATSAPWTPGSTSVVIAGPGVPPTPLPPNAPPQPAPGPPSFPAVTDACKCICQWGGTIKVQDAGQTGIDVD